MSSRPASHLENASSSNGASARSTPPDKSTANAITISHLRPPPFTPTTESPSKNDNSSLAAAISRIDEFVQTLLFTEQRSILRDYAVRYIELFSVFYCDSKNLLRMKHETEYIPNNCKITVPLQPVEGILELQAYKDLATEVASYRESISRRIKGFVIRCKTLNNNSRKYDTIECFVKALPNIAEILIAESESPPPIDKHDLVSAYIATYHTTITTSLSVTLPELQKVYQQVHLHPLCPTFALGAPSADNPYTPRQLLGDFVVYNQTPSHHTPSTISDPDKQTPSINTPILQDTHPKPLPPLQTPIQHPPANPYPPNKDPTPQHKQSHPNNPTQPNADDTTIQPPVPPTNPTDTETPSVTNPTNQPNITNTSTETSYHETPHDNTDFSSSLFSYTNPLPTPETNPPTFQPADTTTITMQRTPTPTPNSTLHNPLYPLYPPTNQPTNPTPNNPLPPVPPNHPLLIRLYTAIQACFLNAQAAYVNQYSHNAISFNLKRVIMKQRLANTADDTATILAAEQPTPSKTIKAAIEKQVKSTETTLTKRLQTVENHLHHEKIKRIRLEQMSKRFTPPNPSRQPTQPIRQTTTPPSALKKDGAYSPGAIPKKYAVSWTAPPVKTPRPPTHRSPQNRPPPHASRITGQQNNDIRSGYSNYDNYTTKSRPNEKYKHSKPPKNKWWAKYNK